MSNDKPLLADVINAARQINRHFNVDLVTRVELDAQQIEVEMRMHFADSSRVITSTMMAVGKAGNRIDVTRFQSTLPGVFIPRRTDARNMFGRVKVEMNLSKTQGMHEAILIYKV
jgi:hypothetical protein